MGTQKECARNRLGKPRGLSIFVRRHYRAREEKGAGYVGDLGLQTFPRPYICLITPVCTPPRGVTRE